MIRTLLADKGNKESQIDVLHQGTQLVCVCGKLPLPRTTPDDRFVTWGSQTLRGIKLQLLATVWKQGYLGSDGRLATLSAL